MGDSCKFYTEKGDIIGKIKSISTTDQKHKDFGKINVNWYYYKKEIDYKALGLSEFQQEAIMEGEIFLSNHSDKVWVQSINGKIDILTLKQVDTMELIPINSFLCRAEYDINKR